MSRGNVLALLPPQVSFELLKVWIDVKSICSLDSAFCNKLHRDGFLDILKSDPFRLAEQIIFVPGAADWLLKREIRARSILLFARVDSALANYLHHCGHHITTVEIITEGGETSAEIMTILAAECHNLIHISFANSDVDTPEYKHLLESNPNLQTLHAATLHPYFRLMYTDTSDAWPFLNMNLPYLLKLSVNHFKSSPIKKVLTNPQAHFNGRNYGTKVGDVTPVNSFTFNFHKSNTALSRIPLCCPYLVSLSLANVNVGDATLTTIVTQCRSIMHLDLENTGISDAGILSVVTNLQLQSLNIQKCIYLTSESLTLIATHCADSLHTLYLNRNEWDGPQYQDDAFITLLQRCTHVRTISYISEFEETSSDLLYESTPYMSNLTTLILHGDGDPIPHRNLLQISEHCKKLTTLCFTWPNGPEFEDTDIPELVSGCPNLKHLVVYCDRSESRSAVSLVRNVALWRSMRRQLIVESKVASADQFRFDVLQVGV